jgi:hypothetical protein
MAAKVLMSDSELRSPWRPHELAAIQRGHAYTDSSGRKQGVREGWEVYPTQRCAAAVVALKAEPEPEPEPEQSRWHGSESEGAAGPVEDCRAAAAVVSCSPWRLTCTASGQLVSSSAPHLSHWGGASLVRAPRAVVRARRPPPRPSPPAFCAPSCLRSTQLDARTHAHRKLRAVRVC